MCQPGGEGSVARSRQGGEVLFPPLSQHPAHHGICSLLRCDRLAVCFVKATAYREKLFAINISVHGTTSQETL